MPVTLQDIRNAAEVLSGNIVPTPCLQSKTLSEITGANVFLKFENQQFTASFKDRGAWVKLYRLSAKQRAQGIIAMSAGNHAQAVAYHAERLGIAATIVMPRHTPNVKVARTRGFGAEVMLYGKSLEESFRFTQQLVQERDLQRIHPYDDEHIISGQGTIAIEMLEAEPALDVLFVPVGGGGLISGVAIAAKAIRPEIEIIGVQTRRFPAVHQALSGKPIECEAITIADGIGVKVPGALTLPIIREHVNQILLVSEREIEAAVLLLLEIEKSVIEGAGAVGLAALLKYPERFRRQKVGLILSGGNIDMLSLSSIIQRGLVRSKRLIRLHVGIPDIPGGLAEVTALFKQSKANIIQIHHQRTFTTLSLRSAEVEFVLETLGAEHVREILETLERAGYRTALCGDEEMKKPERHAKT